MTWSEATSLAESMTDTSSRSVAKSCSRPETQMAAPEGSATIAIRFEVAGRRPAPLMIDVSVSLMSLASAYSRSIRRGPRRDSTSSSSTSSRTWETPSSPASTTMALNVGWGVIETSPTVASAGTAPPLDLLDPRKRRVDPVFLAPLPTDGASDTARICWIALATSLALACSRSIMTGTMLTVVSTSI